MAHRHPGNIPPGEVQLSANAPEQLGPWPAHPFTDPPRGDDGQYVTARFLGRDWYAMWGSPWAAVQEETEVRVGDEMVVVPAGDVWVEFHSDLADASAYVRSGAGYPSLYRQQPSPKLMAMLRRRTPWADITPRTLQGYRGRLRHQAHVYDPRLQAEWHAWAPELLWLRRHKDRHGQFAGPPPSYLWASLWPQPPA